MSDFVPVNGDYSVDMLSADSGEEFPFLHTITVVDRVISVDKPELIQNNIKTETVTLNLDSEWDGLSCVINIGPTGSPVSLIWSGDPIIIPAELMTDVGTLDVSVVGYGDDGAVRAVTKEANKVFTVVASGYVNGDDVVPDPTTIIGQLVEAADNANKATDNANTAAGNVNDAIDKANKSYIGSVKTNMIPFGGTAESVFANNVLTLNIPNARGLQISYVASDVDSLPKSGADSGELAMVQGELFVWNGSSWISQGTPVVSSRDGIRIWKGWQDPTVIADNDVRNGDLWFQTPHYLTDIDPDNGSDGASTAEYYTYAQGEEDNSPSVLILTSQIVTGMLEYSNGAWLSLIWRLDSNLTPGKTSVQNTGV